MIQTMCVNHRYFTWELSKLLHLALTPGRLLHGIAKFRILVLFLHLGVNLLYKGGPRSTLTGLASSRLTLTTSSACHSIPYA